jgi:hypothetical protein
MSYFKTTSLDEAAADFAAYLADVEKVVAIGENGEVRPLEVCEGEIVQTQDTIADFQSRNHKRTGYVTSPAGARIAWFHDFQARKGMPRVSLWVADYGTFRLVYFS